MDLEGRVVVVTGGGGGIGAGLCRAFADRGARAVVVADLDGAAAERVATEVGGGGTAATAVALDVGAEVDVRRLVAETEAAHGPIDLFCANAGIIVVGGTEVADDDWDRIWRVNVLSHVYAARAVLPGMRARGEGYLLHTASAAGLLTQLGSAPYSVTKHAVVGLAEWLSITHASAGIKVSCLCPQAVDTAMIGGTDPAVAEAATPASSRRDGILSPAAVADAVVEGLAEERFLILPHPEVAEYERRRADDRERWLRGMRRAQDALEAAWPGGVPGSGS
jgi:NAD(P)-dependent dehydrogenase (short-subunit alcohol dehydrogenase family)